MSTRPSTTRRADGPSTDLWAAWLWFVLFAIPPRVIILAFWIFGSQIGDAFGSRIVPILGFFLAPSTVLAYAMVWTIDDSVSGLQWLIVALGALIDLWTWGAFARIRQG